MGFQYDCDNPDNIFWTTTCCRGAEHLTGDLAGVGNGGGIVGALGLTRSCRAVSVGDDRHLEGGFELFLKVFKL